VTSIIAAAPPEKVWKILYDPARFPEWLAGVETVGVSAESTVICLEDGGFRLDHTWRLTPLRGAWPTLSPRRDLRLPGGSGQVICRIIWCEFQLCWSGKSTSTNMYLYGSSSARCNFQHRGQ
jgi:hypothetical protein